MNRRRPTAGTATTLLLVVAGCALTAGSLAGVRLLPVLTGSMAPRVPAGALVVTTRVHPTDVHPGDVVAFRPPPPYRVAGDRPVFHRVAGIDTTAQGWAMTTKGDANPQVDPWRVSLEGADLARQVVVVPHLGRLLAGGRLALALFLAGAAVLARAPQALARRHRATTRSCTCPEQGQPVLDGAIGTSSGAAGLTGAARADGAPVGVRSAEPDPVVVDLPPAPRRASTAVPSGLLPRPRTAVEDTRERTRSATAQR